VLQQRLIGTLYLQDSRLLLAPLCSLWMARPVIVQASHKSAMWEKGALQGDNLFSVPRCMFPAPAWRGSTPAERIREPLLWSKKSPSHILCWKHHWSIYLPKPTIIKRHPSVKQCLGRAVNNTWVKLTILRRPIPRIVTKAPMSNRLTCQGQSKTTTQQKASQSDTTQTILLSHASTWSFFVNLSTLSRVMPETNESPQENDM
jgi:hypothetical protein